MGRMTGAGRRRWLRPRGIPGRVPGLIVALVALVGALGGTSYAGFRLGAGSVGTKQLRNGAVTSGKLAPGAVTSGKLAPGAVTSGKLAPGGVTGGLLANGAVTAPKLAPGAVGAQQAQPGAGVSLAYDTSTNYPVEAGGTAAIYETCPPAMNAIGGGALPDDPHMVLLGTGPYRLSPGSWGVPADAWAASVKNTDPGAVHSFVVFAVCITAGAVK